MHAILGTMTFSDEVDRAGTEEMIGAFLAAGHSQLDTAHIYNGGKTEALLGDLNKDGVIEGAAFATKVDPSVGGLGADAIEKQFSTSLQRLNETSVDLLYLHAPDPDVSIETTLRAVQAHYKAGRFKRFGVSNYPAWQVAEIVEMCRRNAWVEPSVYQGMYNALTRDVERELFPCLSHYNLAFYAFNPLAGGMLTGKHQNFEEAPQPGRFADRALYQERYWNVGYFDAVHGFSEASRGEGIPPAAAAIRWMFHHSELATLKTTTNPHGVILGATSMAQLTANIDAVATGPLPKSVVDALDSGWESARLACPKYFRP